MSNIKTVPSQMKTIKQKTKSWAKETMDALVDLNGYDSDIIRGNIRNKIRNYKEFNGYIDEKDIIDNLNPLGLQGKIPAKIQNHPIEIGKFNVLLGEESLRKFDWQVKTVNADAVSNKLAERKEMALATIKEIISNSNMSPEMIEKRLKEHDRYVNYEYRDFQEITGERVLKYLEKKLDLKYLTNRGFLDKILSADEIYRVDIIANSPYAVKCNPPDLVTLGTSRYIDEKDVVIERTRMSINEVLDNYYEWLTDKDVRRLEEASKSFNKVTNALDPKGGFTVDNDNNIFTSAVSESGVFDVSESMVDGFGNLMIDEDGNFIVTRIVWASMRKILILHYPNEYGEMMEREVDESYPVNKEAGEWAETKWIKEYWEGTKIDDIYIKIQPRPIQYREMENVSICKNGYVGTTSSINDMESVSMYDRIRPIKYLYNIYSARLELAFAKDKGPIKELNLSTIPDGWETDEYLYYLDVLGYHVSDPFTIQKKGAAQGKMAGQFNQFGMRTMNADSSGYIQQHIGMLEFLKQELADITGVSRQREGNITSSETVGGVERSISKSSHITAPEFYEHDETKRRLYQTVLDTAQVAWSSRNNDKPIPLDFISDGVERVIFAVDPQMFGSCQYGIFVSNSADDTKTLEDMRNSAQQAIMNGHMKLSQLAKISSSRSIMSITRDLEKSEIEAEQRAAQQQKELEAQRQQGMEYEAQMKQKEFEMELTKQREKSLSDKEIKLLEINKDIALKKLETDSKEKITLEQLQEMSDKYDKDYEIAKKNLEEEIRSNKAKEEIDKNKTKPKSN